MALIEIYHVVAADKPVKALQSIKEGMIVSLNSSSEVVKQNVTDAIPYGIAGDTKSTSGSAMPGVVAGWQNRVSDYFDESKASGKMTVYHSGGEFATDQFVSAVANLAVNAPLYAVDGLLSDVDTQSSGIVARITKAAGMEMSGVPGVDINGDQALSGDYALSANEYIEIKLLI